MWAWTKRHALGFWRTLRSPSRYYSLGFLTVAGFVAGVMFWGGFNTALEATNTEEFCTSCHEMRDNVFQELKGTIHYTNRSGVRATCPDCHVPHDWTDKIARKMQASKAWRISSPVPQEVVSSGLRCAGGTLSRPLAAAISIKAHWRSPDSP